MHLHVLYQIIYLPNVVYQLLSPILYGQVEMQDQVAIVGTVDECRTALKKRRDAGLQMPVIAPYAVGDNKASHRHVIDALAPESP